jgi:hypothetical protein
MHVDLLIRPRVHRVGERVEIGASGCIEVDGEVHVVDALLGQDAPFVGEGEIVAVGQEIDDRAVAVVTQVVEVRSGDEARRGEPFVDVPEVVRVLDAHRRPGESIFETIATGFNGRPDRGGRP